MKLWFEKTLTGLKPHDDEARQALSHIKVGTVFETDIVTKAHRSRAWHRRYWLLMSMLADNVGEVDLGHGAMMAIHDAEDMHTAVKLLTGHCHTYTTEVNGQVHIVRIPKTTNFREMTPEQWSKYWLKVLDAVHQNVLPNVGEYIEDELARLAS